MTGLTSLCSSFCLGTRHSVNPATSLGVAKVQRVVWELVSLGWYMVVKFRPEMEMQEK
jgi:hypothetical protein